jgi:flagellar protein FlaJ
MSNDAAGSRVEPLSYEPTPPHPDLDREAVRSAYGPIRAYFKLRPEQYADVQVRLEKARMEEPYDVFLTGLVRQSLSAFALGVAVTLAYALVLFSLAPIRIPVAMADGAVSSSLVLDAPVDSSSYVVAVLAALDVGLLVGFVVGVAKYVAPEVRVAERKRAIRRSLPHALMYMFALSRGSIELANVFRDLATASETYGGVSEEIRLLVSDVESFDMDFDAALERAQRETPSPTFAEFLGDLSNVGRPGSRGRFFERKAEQHLEAARRAQRRTLETLSVFAEVYISVVFATPLFLLVILITLSLTGQAALDQAYLVTYGGVPLGIALTVLGVSAFTETYEHPADPAPESLEPSDGHDAVAPPRDDPRFERYRKSLRMRRLRRTVANVPRMLRERPDRSLLVSVPAALVVVAAAHYAGVATLSLAAFEDRPLQSTTWLLVAPGLVALTPLSVLHERQRRLRMRTVRRFPEVLDAVANANESGETLPEALSLVGRRVDGPLAAELRRVRTDVNWGRTTDDALVDLANRVGIVTVSRAVRILLDGQRATDNIGSIARLIARDMRNQYEMEVERQESLQSYVAIVVIGVGVYLMILVVLDVFFLSQFTALSLDDLQLEQTIPLASNIPQKAYRTVFYHSSLLQAIGNGIVLGLLVENDLRSGLKYAIPLVLVVVAVFTVAIG